MSPRFRAALSLGTLAILVAACGPSDTSATIGGGEPRFPIIGNDPAGLVETMEWGESPAIDLSSAGEDFLAEVLDTSTSEVVRIAVQGSQCPPSVRVLIGGSPANVTVDLVLGASLPPPGIVCGEVLTTHTLIVYFREPIEIGSLQVTARRTGE